MSFLNPISLPVKRYSSTDEGAPQLSFSQHSTFKNVLKACLVTGFGSKEGAGWTIVDNSESETGIALRAPDVIMVNDILEIMRYDSSQMSLRWKHRDNSTFSQTLYISKDSYPDTSLGWEVFVTDRGFYFVWRVQRENNMLAAVIYYGQCQHALAENPQKNIVLWASPYSSPFFYSFDNRVGVLAGQGIYLRNSVGRVAYYIINNDSLTSLLQIYDAVYIRNEKINLGLQPGLLTRSLFNVSAIKSPSTQIWGSKNVWALDVGTNNFGASYGFLTDFWEY